ncbi:hypothetical protein ACWPM1_13550 [Tsuneonella sp. HG249]
MIDNDLELGPDPRPEIAALLEANPNASARYAVAELEAGRLDWLAEHIRLCEFHIDKAVARKLLELLDGSHREFRLKMAPRKNRGSRFVPRIVLELRARQMAFEVALEGGFDKRTQLKRACHEVGLRQKPPLGWLAVRRAVRPYRSLAMATLGRGALPQLHPHEQDIVEDAP